VNPATQRPGFCGKNNERTLFPEQFLRQLEARLHGRLSLMGAGRRWLAGLLRFGAALDRQIDAEILSRLAEIARAGLPNSP
jgi:hypothetical protein